MHFVYLIRLDGVTEIHAVYLMRFCKVIYIYDV